MRSVSRTAALSSSLLRAQGRAGTGVARRAYCEKRVCVAFSLAAFASATAAEPTSTLDFELASLAGRFERLSTLPPKPTLVNFWHSECPPCRKELPAIGAFAQSHPGLRVVTVAVQPQPETERDADLLPRGGLHLIAPTDPSGLLARFGDPKGMLPYSVMLDVQRRPCAAHAGEIDAAWMQAALNRCTSRPAY